MATLDAALPLPHVAHRARSVADNLNLNMSRAGNQALNIDSSIPERGLCLGLAARIRLLKLVGAMNHAHPASATTGHGLDQHGSAVAQRGEKRAGLVQAGRLARARQDGDAAALGQGPSLDFIAKQLEDVRTGSDKGDTCLGTPAGKVGILTQKSVARMNGLTAGLFGQLHNPPGVKIGGRTGSAQRLGFIGLAGMQRLGVVLGKHGHGPQPQFGGGPRNTNGDFASIGDQKTAQTHMAHLSGFKVVDTEAPISYVTLSAYIRSP